MKLKTYRPTYAEIDLSAIKHNFLQFRKIADKSVKILVPVKADAYGHGLIPVCRLLAKCGVDYFGTGTTDEAVKLSKARLGVSILNLTSITKAEIAAVINYKIIQTVANAELARLLNAAAGKKGARVKVHLKIDTGMGRLGIWHYEAVKFIRETLKLKHLIVEGIFTHFACADEDVIFTDKQISNFADILRELDEIGIGIKYKHAANSAAVVKYKKAHFNIIRPGIMIYGLYPHPCLNGKIKLKPALALKSRISYIKDALAGQRISYGGTYTTRRRSKIALIPIGYADGYNRLLSNKGEVLIHAKSAPVLGRVCMDQIIVDITNIKNVKAEDEVVLIGAQGKKRITAEKIAFLCSTIPYEITCSISSRVPRVYR